MIKRRDKYCGCSIKLVVLFLLCSIFLEEFSSLTLVVVFFFKNIKPALANIRSWEYCVKKEFLNMYITAAQQNCLRRTLLLRINVGNFLIHKLSHIQYLHFLCSNKLFSYRERLSVYSMIFTYTSLFSL